MNIVHEGPRVKFADVKRVKTLLGDTVTAAAFASRQQDLLYLGDLLGVLTHGVEAFPEVVSAPHPSMEAQGLVIRYEVDGRVHFNVALRVWMPCGESSLVWMPWLPHQSKPPRSPGEFHHIKPGAFYALQARRTKCYGHAYAYSGQTHPLEPETPSEIEHLYRETNAIFGLTGDGGVNMCLENDYANGRHYISEHSDDERSFGAVHDVYCWITGPSAREGVFRVRSMGGRKKDQISETLQPLCCDPTNAYATRDVLSIRIPAGFYVMCGREFQERYTHEFPVLHKSLFDRLAKKCTAEDGPFPEFPREVPATDMGASQRPLVQSGWLQDHRDEVLAQIDAGAFSGPAKKRLEDREAFEEWCLHRTSYTLRNFRADQKRRKNQ